MDDGTIKDYKAAMRDYVFGKMPKEGKLFLFFEKMWKMAEEENEQLKAQLEKAQCCGSCKWWMWVNSKGRYHCEGNEHENYTPAWKLCDKWEARE